MSSPKVTVILTSFNHQNYLAEAIDSVLHQTFADFELVIWDDASSDHSWDIISTYTDSRIRTFRNDEQRRAGFGINKAIAEIARGEYIAIHHSDDVWEKEKLEKQVAFLDGHPHCGAVFTHVQFINERSEKIANDWFNVPNKSRHAWLRELFLNTNRFCHPSVLVRKLAYDKAGLYRFGLAQSNDADMWMRLLKVYDIHVIQEKLTLHRRYADHSNASGDRPDVARRTAFEFYVLKANFLDIHSDDLTEIFPESKKWISREGEGVPEFILAMMAIELGVCTGTVLFGLTLLFEQLNDAAKSQQIKALHHFDYRNFVELSANYDLFFSAERLAHVEWLEAERAAWEKTAREYETSIRNLQEEHQSHVEWLEAERAAWEKTSHGREAGIRCLQEEHRAHVEWLEGERAAWEKTAQEREASIKWLEGERTAWSNMAKHCENELAHLAANDRSLRMERDELKNKLLRYERHPLVRVVKGIAGIVKYVIHCK